MKKIVLTFGLISAALMALFMFTMMAFIDKIGMDKGVLLGYASMVLAFMLVFFGIRSYRDNVGGGSLTFGRAFAVGILITLISSICYVIAWEIVYFNFMPDFLDKYSAYLVEKARAAGATPEAIQKQVDEMQQFKKLYSNPFINFAFSFTEPFPVGLVITFISSLILRRRPKTSQPAEAASA
jgi:hypothetical protein